MSEPLRRRCGLLKNYWYAAARSEELTSSRPIGRNVLGEKLVLWRSAKGVVAQIDRCLHRNALLSEGAIVKGCLACPYHGWTYDSSGKCVNVPSDGPQSKGVPDVQLETFPVREQDGLIWVWMGGDVAPDKEPFPMPHYNEPGWKAYYMTTMFANGVTNLVENFMDVPHTVFVHAGWFRSQKKMRVRTEVERTRDSVLVTYHQRNDKVGFSSVLLQTKGLPLVHTDKFYMPNNTRVDYIWGQEDRAFVITSTCTPITEFETRVYTLISYKVGWFSHVAKFFLPFYTRQVIEQDVVIMANQGASLQHHGPPVFHSTSADLLHKHIEALRDWDEKGGVGERPEPTIETIEMWI
jgi:phenylpropionate dioxygenase-like ring-hydroxylating dioxygenase large terminal subunit